MSAVFIPVGFMDGTVGIFYRQFSLTLASGDRDLRRERLDVVSGSLRLVAETGIPLEEAKEKSAGSFL